MCLTHSPFFIWQILMSVLQKPTTALSMRPALISRGAFAVCLWNVQKITASLEIRKYLLFKVHCFFWWHILLTLLTEQILANTYFTGQAYPKFCTHRSGPFLMVLSQSKKKRYSLKKMPCVNSLHYNVLQKHMLMFSLWLPCNQPVRRITFSFKILTFLSHSAFATYYTPVVELPLMLALNLGQRKLFWS